VAARCARAQGCCRFRVQLTLEPVQQALDQIKSALGSFDLEQELKPVQDVFDQAIAACL
jgi:hypothetical protein